MNGKELKQLALDIEAGKVFTNRHLSENDNHMLNSVFMPLALGADIPKDTGMIYEYSDKAMSGINGYPCFGSLRTLNMDDSRKVHTLIGELRQAIKNFQYGRDEGDFSKDGECYVCTKAKKVDDKGICQPCSLDELEAFGG
jgi:hypothetical protein